MDTNRFFIAFWLVCAALFMPDAMAQTLVWSSSVDTGTCFSSPRAVDLNGDGVLDFVTGGGEEGFYRTKSFNAFDGATGNLLWQVGARNRIYGSAIFMDITADATPDVFIGGGSAEFVAINGTSGQIIWEFFPQGDTIAPEDFGWYNFYSPQFIPDVDGDGLQDILVSNGGNPAATPIDTINRPPGNLLILSSANGSILGIGEAPDGKEIYMSPLVYDFWNDGILDVIYGTGGETTHGSLWRTTVVDILNNDISASVKLIDGGPKGYIAPPALADLTGDGNMDIIAPCYGNKLTAYDVVNSTLLWQKNLPGTETICTPAIGRFTPDHVPDAFFIYATGLAPTFFNFVALMIDGSNGNVLLQDTLPGWSLISPIAFDYNNDGFDEALALSNQPFIPPGPYAHQLFLYDFANNTKTNLTGAIPGTSLAATPWVGDADNDGNLDLVYLHNTNPNIINVNDGFILKRYSLPSPTPPQLAWSAYMGTNYNGVYTNPLQSCFSFVSNSNFGNVSCFGGNNGFITATVNGTPPYRYVWNGNLSAPNFSPVYTVFFSNLPAGNYSLQLTDGVGCSANYNITLTQPEPIVITPANITPPTPGNNDGSLTIAVTGGILPYVVSWSHDAALNAFTAGNLASGEYIVTITDANGCTASQSTGVFVTGTQPHIATEQNMVVYPNPANDRLTIQLPPNLSLPNQATLYLYNNVGQQLLCRSVMPQTQPLILDMAAYPAGAYTLELTTNLYTIKQRLAVVR
ncbi:MAG TPA: T9SS type A sorting domain-containing protein [Chitinophagales bacterium]|nr:T9SS type A sorting domain-containing protein [Chitinophagales bacterium]HRK25711.1 T9SS type A sorting domain-containing protein [Chitinophagales bacterium]